LVGNFVQRKDLFTSHALLAHPGVVLYTTTPTTEALPKRFYASRTTEQKKQQVVQQVVVDGACRQYKTLNEMMMEDCVSQFPITIEADVFHAIKKAAQEHMVRSINEGLAPVKHCSFLHTSPHHDDIALGYLGYLIKLIKEPSNRHTIGTMTSGSNGVRTNDLLEHVTYLVVMSGVNEFFLTNFLKQNPEQARVYTCNMYHDGIQHNDVQLQRQAASLRLLRNVAEWAHTTSLPVLMNLFESLGNKHDGIQTVVKFLKGCLREFEDELLWSKLGLNLNDVHHMRLNIYQKSLATIQYTSEDDIRAIVQLLNQCKPNIITIACDPEGSGPETHHKVLLVLSKAIEQFYQAHKKHPLRIWCYRNVWTTYQPLDANLMVPVNDHDLILQAQYFKTFYKTQVVAAYPNQYVDAPFCDISNQVMRKNITMMRTMLGGLFFDQHSNAELVQARGFIFLRALDPITFFNDVFSMQKYMF
jgi:glucosamine-6-phosphate deaminase